MINKLLIANRGEIACRIIRTARAMGIATVAVYSDADAKALHVRSAAEAVHIGPSPAAESYLRGDRIIAAAKETGAEAIHPGYGFLSENTDFARAVIDAGLIWVGPKPESIEAMGLKDAAKKLMRAAGVPVTPGYEGEGQSVERLKAEADAIGYPVLIKAVAGGGGKGMRKVDAAADFEASLESCRREAKASFSNDEVLLEKWITSPRHIEVQVFGDAHGNVVHLFERDCSLQRRHQKVIEEAPAPGMDEATREAICAAAVRAAKAVDYEGAGTIEFIADASEGLRADRIFFMEMNTRLQVEHPVTEEITGVDLVEWQLRVASGETIPLPQEELSISGHAIEARLYAEDPAKGFLPSTGTLEVFHPTEDFYESYSRFDLRMRLDEGVIKGDEITPFYDPMIAKLIVHGDNREIARSELASIVRETKIWPIKTNLPLLFAVLSTDEFIAGAVTTDFIAMMPQAYASPPDISEDTLTGPASSLGASFEHQCPRELLGFRLNQNAHGNIALDINGTRADVPFPVQIAHHTSNSFLERDGQAYYFAIDGHTIRASIFRADGGGTTTAADGAILAPMPGKVIAVDVTEGQQVEAGQRLLVLEAMKMEHALTAPFAGTVTEFAASEGAQVQVEALLAVVEPQDG